MGAKGMREHPPQQLARPKDLAGQLVEEFETEQHLRRRLQRHERLLHRLADHEPRRLWVGEEVEIGHGRRITRGVRRTPGDHEAGHEFDDRRITLEHPRHVAERTESENRDLAGMGLDALPDHLLRLMPTVELHPGEFGPAEPVGPVQAVGDLEGRRVTGGGAEAGQSRRIEK